MKKQKKAALQLSINAIVIMVIAFVVLGLALTLTRTIFKAGTERAVEAMGVPLIEAKANVENPLTIPPTVSISSRKSKELTIEYYNKAGSPHTNVALGIKSCIDPSTGLPVNATKLPIMVTASATVGPAEVMQYKAILTENGLVSQRKYICIAVAYTPNSPGALPGEENIYESKQFFLEVTG